jgi:DNA-binding transcriptional ArsR family regulator
MTEPREPDVVFHALADPTRREVLRVIARSGPTTLAELSAGLPISRQAVSKHLALLREAGLVQTNEVVRGRTYTLSAAPLADAMDWIMDIGAEWDERLTRLRHIVEDRRR